VIGEPAYRRQLEALRAELASFFEGVGAPPLSEWRSTTRQELTIYGQ